MVDEIPPGVTNVDVQDFEDLDEEVRTCTEDVLIVDSMKGVENMIFDFVCRTQFKNNWDGFMDYWKGPRIHSPPVLERWLDRMSRHLARGCHVILIGHVATTELPNTMGADYQSHVLLMDDGDKGGMRSSVMRWAPNVLFMNISVEIEQSTKKGTGTERNIVKEGKAADIDNRILYTTKSPGHAAKNKLHLPPIIPLGKSAEEGFDNFVSSLPEKLRNEL